MFHAMGSRNWTKHDVMEFEFPVRIRVAVRGDRDDWGNEQVRRWLVRNCGPKGSGVRPAHGTRDGRRCAYIHLPTVFHAAGLLLACPHLELVTEEYHGPLR